MQLANKIALITGGTGGVGMATAQQFIAEGARVVITDIDVAAGEAAAKALDVDFVAQDVSSAQDWTRVAEYIEQQYGRLDVLINNAAILRSANIEAESLENFQRVMHVNTDSVFLGMQAMLPLLVRQGGSIINMSSSSALLGFPHFCAYTASKAAVRSLTMSTAVYCKQQGNKVRCNSVHPDGIATPMVMNIEGEPVVMDQAKSIHAASFMCEPQAIADVLVFLASDASRHINGAAISVDNTSTIHPPYL
jgi:3(or 17)beta-hydroxysteroid dehydrogenase